MLFIKFISSLLIVFTLLFNSIIPVLAQTTEKWGNIDNRCSTNGVANLQGIECIFYNIMKIIIPLVGFAAFIIVISAGFQYLTSGGDPKQTQKAKTILTSTIIGIIVMLAIWFVFTFLKSFTGINVLEFAIPG